MTPQIASQYKASHIEFHPTPSAVKAIVVLGAGGALVGGLIGRSVLAAAIGGVAAPVAVFALLASMMKGWQ